MRTFIRRNLLSFEFRPEPLQRYAGIGLFVMACAASAVSLYLFPDDAMARYGWLPYLLGCIFFVPAVYLLVPYKNDGRRLPQISKTTIIIAVFILGLAAFMRFYRVGSLPFGTWSDETYIGEVVRNILSDPTYRPIYVLNYDHPLHFYGLVAFAFQIFGDTTVSIRYVTALFGLATVAVAFMVGRESFGNRFGLVLAFFFAISRWHVTFSRFGVYTISMPFFEMLTIWLLLRARRTHQIHDFMWAGLAFGLGLNFYIGIRLFVPVVAIYLLLWLISSLRNRAGSPDGQTPALPVLLSGLLVMTLAGYFAFAPVAQYAVTHSSSFWSRTGDVSIFSQYPADQVPSAVLANTLKHLWMFNYIGDPNGRHNLSGAPMLDPVMGILFVLGLALALSRFRQPIYALFLLLFVFNMLGGILSLDFEAPQSNRALGAVSAVLFFSAISVETLWRGLERQNGLSQASRRGIQTMTALGFAGFIIFSNANTYFVKQVNDGRTWKEFNGPETLTAQRMLALDPANTTIYASMYLYNHPVITFLAPQITNSHVLIAPIGLPVREPGDKPVAIFVDEENTWIVDEAKRIYPDATIQADNGPDGSLALVSIYIPTQDIQRLQGVTASYWAGDSIQGNPELIRTEKSLSADWAGQPPVSAPFMARLETSLYVPQYGRYELILNSPDTASLWLDGQKILTGSGEQHFTGSLAEGDHVLSIEVHSGSAPFDLQWRAPGTDGSLAPDPAPVPLTSLYIPDLVPVHGLLGNYYKNGDWAPPLGFSRIDPFLDSYFHLLPYPRPYTVDWRGQIDIPANGDWTFALRINGKAQVLIDGQLVIDAPEANDDIEGKISLTAGRHAIQVRYLDLFGNSRLHLSWMAPGGKIQIIPADALYPFP